MEILTKVGLKLSNNNTGRSVKKVNLTGRFYTIVFLFGLLRTG
jgi:hypothetical protein